MKKLIFPSILSAFFVIVSCSKDDSKTPECESCTVEGESWEFCENEDGTFTVTSPNDGSETLTTEELEEIGLSFDTLVALTCSL